MLKTIIHLKDLIHRFNASNCVLYCCLLVFSVLLSLRVDNIIVWHYAVIFIPLWVWNMLILAGLIVGVAFWVKKRRLRYSARSACAGSGEQATEPGISVPLRERDQYKNSMAQFNALLVRDGSSVEEVWLSTDVNLTFDISHVISIIHPFPLLPLTGVVWLYRQLNNRIGQDRQEPEHVHHFKALLLSVALQFPVFLTEVLVVINLETGQMHPWRAIFTPLYFLAGASIAPCVWACWRKRSVDLEVLAMANLLQLVFLGIRLDRVVYWSWAIVFIPTWLLLCLSAIAVGFRAGILVILYRIGENQQELDQKRPVDIFSVLCSFMVIGFLTVFMALLASQLDGRILASYTAIFIPLHLVILTLMASTITRTPGNPWWFGIRKNFVDFVLDNCPILQEYVNVSYRTEDQEEEQAAAEGGHSKHRTTPTTVVRTPDPKLYPYEDIYAPD